MTMLPKFAFMWEMSMFTTTLWLLMFSAAGRVQDFEFELEKVKQSLSQYLKSSTGTLSIENATIAYRYVERTLREENGALSGVDLSELRGARGLPDVWGMRMTHHRQDYSRPIEGPKDLQGLVSIVDETAARTYLDLFTSVYTICLYPDHPYVPVVQADEQTPKEFASASLAQLNERFDLVWRDQVVKRGSGFVRTRYLLEYDFLRPVALHATIERVSDRGEYELVIVKTKSFGELTDIIHLPKEHLPS